MVSPFAYKVLERGCSAVTQPISQLAVRGLPPDPAILRPVRMLVAKCCRDWGVPAATSVAELVTVELLSNAIEHARTESDVSLMLTDGHVEVIVHDSSPAMPEPPKPRAPSETHGRGLLLVEKLSVCWGSLPAGIGKLVWALVPIPQPEVVPG